MGIRTVLYASIYLLSLGSIVYMVHQGYVSQMVDRLPSAIDRVQDMAADLMPLSTRSVTPYLPATVDIELTTIDRDLDNLTPETKQLALDFLELARESGYYLFVTEWKRSLERQKALYDQWRTQPGPVVSWTMNSRHIRGTAFDVAFEPAYHGTAYPSNDTLRTAIWEIWESLGLTRWGRWRNPDKPHFQNGW